jgi:hypothetical protein
MDNLKVLKRDKRRLADHVDEISKEFELRDDLITLVLKAKMGND